MKIETVIEIVRIMQGLTKEELCKRTHIGVRRFRLLVNGRCNWTMEDIEKFETALGIPTGVLVWFGATECLSEPEAKEWMMISAFEYLERNLSGKNDRKEG